MSQHDQIIDDAPGLAVRTDMNAAYAALFSTSSGPIEPSVKVPGQLWCDTSTPAVMRVAVRDQTNATWVNLMLDPSAVAGTMQAGDSLEASGPNSFVVVPGGCVHVAGDIMTGGLKITKTWAAVGDEAIVIAPSSANAVASLALVKTGTGAGQIRGYIGSLSTAGLRWSMAVGNAVAETGGNVGSDFSIARYTDAGALVDNSLTITRSNGAVTLARQLQVSGGSQTIKGGTDSANPILSLLDSSSASRAQFYCNVANGIVYLTNVIGACNINFGNNGNVTAAPGTGGNFIVAPGAGYQAGGGSWGALSDARIKTVQGDYVLGLAEVLALRPVVYTYKGNEKTDEDTDSMHKAAAENATPFVGLVAQEAEIIFPGMVGKQAGWIDGEAVDDLRTLNNSELIYALVNAVKTLSARIEALEAAS